MRSGELPRRRAADDDLVGAVGEHPPFDDLDLRPHRRAPPLDTPRSGTLASLGSFFVGWPTMTKSSGEAIGPRSFRAMPGVSMMSRAVSPLRPLVISVSLPARITITVCGSPTPAIAAREAFGDRQHAEEHDDDAGDADDRDGGRAEPLRGSTGD